MCHLSTRLPSWARPLPSSLLLLQDLGLLGQVAESRSGAADEWDELGTACHTRKQGHYHRCQVHVGRTQEPIRRASHWPKTGRCDSVGGVTGVDRNPATVTQATRAEAEKAKQEHTVDL